MGVLRKDRFNITTPLDKTRNIKIKRKDAQARALSELGSIWQSLNDVKTPKMNVSKSLQRKVDREARKCSRTFGRMDVLVERTQNIIADVQEQIERAEEERRKKLEEEKKRLNRKNRIENTFKSKLA